VFLVALFLAAFVPRALYPVSRPLQWYERSFRFVDAVLRGQWADTIVSEHPGVTPMWLIGLAQHGYYALLRALGASPAHPTDITGRAFSTEVAISVLPLAAGIALGVLLAWWLLRHLFGETVAWAGAGFLALDPFHIAISKVVHVDALLSVLMILSALTLLLYLRRSVSGEQRRSLRPTRRQAWSRHRLLLASGALAGLAFLTKSPAYFLVPFLGLSLLVARGRGNLWRDYLTPMLLWIGTAAITYVLLWPAMWVQPVSTLATVLGGVLKHTGRAHPQPLYYLGSLITEDPGPGYYVVTLLVKTTALTLPLFVVGLISPLAATWRRERQSLGLLVAYFVFFFVQMSLGAKKAPRYLLPAFPALDVIAGVGLVTMIRHAGLPRLHAGLPRLHAGLPRLDSWRAHVAATRRLVPGGALVAAALAVQAALVWPYHPYYITHASLLVGGPAGSQRYLLATPEGEGLDLVADYLNHLPGAKQLRVGVQMPAWEAFRQYFVGEVADTREPDLDYLVFADVYVRRHMAEDQWGEQWERYKYRRPEYTAYLHGMPYARAYRVDDGPQQPVVPLQVCVGEQIRLLGYTALVEGATVDGRAIQPGESLHLTLHWTATGTPDGDYSVFVHLLGPDGTLVTQQDNPPLHGTVPTFLWEPGERLDDPFELVIPPDASPGAYTLTVGMYDWRTGERLEALADCAAEGESAAPLPEDRIVLTTFDVRPERVPWWEVLGWILAGALIAGGVILARPDLAPITRWAKRWWVPLLYTLLTLMMTYPLPLRLGTHYVGTGSDFWMFPWNDWWCQKCLLEGRNPFFTTWLFYPQGVSLAYHNFAWLNSAMGLVLSPLMGSIAAGNVIFLFNLALGGMGMHALVHGLTGDHRAASIAGSIFAFWPYRMSHYNHPNMISVGWVPLGILFLVRTIREEPKFKSALLAALFLALTGLARWLLLLFTGGVIVVYLAYSVSFERQCWNRRTFLALGLIFGLAAVLVAPLLFPLVSAQIRGGEQAEEVFIAQPSVYGTDLISYLVPEWGHPFFRPWLDDLWVRMGRGAYVGYTALALASVGVLKGRRERILWLTVGAGLFVLALGPDVQVAGRHLDVRLPYAWVQDWSVVRVVRHPNRFNIMLGLPLAVLAGYGAAWWLPRRRRPIVWTLGLILLVLIEYLPWPYPTIQPNVPPFYHQLAREPGDFAVLDLPMGASSAAKEYMYYATVHGKPLVEGHVSRPPRSAYDFIDSVPLLHGLHEDDEMDPTLCDVSRQLSALAQVNIRYIILHANWVPPERLARWREWLAIRPAYEDGDTIVYRTALQHGQDFEFLGTMGDGIGVIDAALSPQATLSPQAALSPSETSQDRTLAVELVWGSQDAPERDWTAQVALVSSAGTEVGRVNFAPCADWPTSHWGENAVARGRGTMKIDAGVEAGTYTVTLKLVDAITGTRAGDSLAVGQIEIPGTATP
jgi:hypothetical protein